MKDTDKEVYTPLEIVNACSITAMKHGKIYIDELLLELKRTHSDASKKKEKTTNKPNQLRSR